MERNKEFIKETLEEIEKSCEANGHINIIKKMAEKGYSYQYCSAQLKIIEEAGFIQKFYTTINGDYYVSGLTNLGYDYLDKAREVSNTSESQENTVVNITYDQKININSKKINNANISSGNGGQQTLDKKSELSLSSTTNNAEKQTIFSKVFLFFKKIFFKVK